MGEGRGMPSTKVFVGGLAVLLESSPLSGCVVRLQRVSNFQAGEVHRKDTMSSPGETSKIQPMVFFSFSDFLR